MATKRVFVVVVLHDHVISARQLVEIHLHAGVTQTLSLAGLTAFFPGEPGLAGFIEDKDDGSGGDNWSYKMCKAPVSVREYVFYVFFRFQKKHDFLRFFEMTYQKVVKSL